MINEKEKMVNAKTSGDELKRVFVIGCPRSGTTWMTLLLASHSSITAFQHSKFFHYLRALEKWWELKENPKQRPVPIMQEEDFYALCRNFAVGVFDKVSERAGGVSVVVDKTPENVRISKSILNIFPEAYFLHVVRDPRAVFSSMRSAATTWTDRWEFPRKPLDGARFWRSAVQQGRTIQQSGNHYFEVQYEALHSQGPEALSNIFQWLDLPADDKLCAQAFEACRIDKVREKSRMPDGFFRKGLAEAWREELSAADIRLIEYVAGDLMQALGYQLCEKPLKRLPLSVRALTAVEKALAANAHASNALLRRVRGREFDFPELVIY